MKENNKASLLPQSQHSSKQTIFFTKKQRFSKTVDNTPGPGAYDHMIKQKKTLDFRHTHLNKQKLQYAWIYGSGRNSFGLTASHVPGPGQYGSNDTFQKKQTHSNWGKDKRFSLQDSKKIKIGPGSYEYKQNKMTASPSSMFKSKSPKSFIDEIIARTAKTLKSNPQQEFIQQQEQIVTFDQAQYVQVKKDINKMSPIFMSKSKRSLFQSDSSLDKVGPGSYSIQKKLQQIRNSNNKKVISSIHYELPSLSQKQKQQLKLSKLAVPGPGTYNTQENNKNYNAVPNLIVSKQQRFKTKSQRDIIPGPGEYMQRRFTLINQESLGLSSKPTFAKKIQKHHNFGLAQRAQLSNRKDIPFGSYNLKQYDIQTKIMKQKQYYDKLKMMEVTLPAFSTKKH